MDPEYAKDIARVLMGGGATAGVQPNGPWYNALPPTKYSGTGLEGLFDPDNQHVHMFNDRGPTASYLHHQSQMFDPDGYPNYPIPGPWRTPAAYPPINWRDLKPDWYNPGRLSPPVGTYSDAPLPLPFTKDQT